MRLFIYYFLIFLFFFSSPLLPGEEKEIVITNVKIIDPMQGKVEYVKYVVITGGEIKEIIKEGAYTISEDALIINGEGKFLTPGLIDCHVHLSGSPGSNTTRTEFLEVSVKRNLLGYLACGVTTIRDLCNDSELIESLRKESEAGYIFSPDIIMSGPAFTAPDGHPTQIFKRVPGLIEKTCRLVSDEDAARQMVKDLTGRVDIIKAIYDDMNKTLNLLNIDVLKAIVDETHRHGKKITVHTGGDYRFLKDIVLSGADGIEHSCLENIEIEENLILKMISNNVIYDPTLIVMKNYEDINFGNPGYKFDEWSLSRINSNIVKSTKSRNAWWNLIKKRDIAQSNLSFEYGKNNLLTLYRAGVKVAVGTDAGNPFTFHGPSLIKELNYMKQAGLTEKEIIYNAFITSAEAVGLKDKIGEVKEGFKANLLLLSANPLEDINNFRKLERLILDGKIVDIEKILLSINPENKSYVPESDLIDDFNDNNREGNIAGYWESMTDIMLAGESSADLSFSDGVMKISGNVSSKAGFASFAGSTINFFHTDYEGFNVTDYTGIKLNVRGDGKEYRITLNSQKVIDFDEFFTTFETEKNNFSEVLIPFSQLKQFGFGEKIDWDGNDVYGLSILTFGNPGKDYFIEIDKIEFY